MNVAGSVHLSPPVVTSDSRVGAPTHRAAIELKYGAFSVSVNEISFAPFTLMPSLAFAASSSALVAFFVSIVFQASQPTMMYAVKAYSPATFGSQVRVKPYWKSFAVTGEPSEYF